MKIHCYYHDIFLKHNPGAGHPERAERLEAILKGVKNSEIEKQIQWQTPISCSKENLYKAHQAPYVDSVLATKGIPTMFDGDTRTSEKSVEAAMIAAGAAINATKMVLAHPQETAFCISRPPGHHAEKDRAMGFCLFNNIAVAAAYAVAEQNLERVLIFDPDIHHGNGTENIFYDQKQVFYISIHQSPFYPGTGHIEDQGQAEGKGYNANFPIPGGLGDTEYLYITKEFILKTIDVYQPQLILFSAGFDAHQLDPLGSMQLSSQGFVQMYMTIIEKAQQQKIPCAFILEGGYSLDALEETIPMLLNAIDQDNYAVPDMATPDPLVVNQVKKLEGIL